MSDQRYQRTFGPQAHYPNVIAYKRPPSSDLITVAGPCSVESPEQIEVIARELSRHGVKYLRGGVFRAGTYPRSKAFGWVDERLIAEFSRAAHDFGMKCVIEVLDYHPDSLRMVSKYADAYQIGARQMQNYTLLDILGRTKRTVFLKRNVGATLDEFLGSAEWLLRHNLCDPILIERGGSTYHNHVRWDLSISMIPAVKKITEIPIIVDASHGTGRRDLVEPMTLAGVAAGADGFLVEVHPDPDKSLSDSEQALPLEKYRELRWKAKRVSEIATCELDDHVTIEPGHLNA